MTSPVNALENPTGQPSFEIDLHDSSQEQFSIIVVNRNRPEYLNMCLQSIHCMSNLNNFETIVVDNGSDQQTQEYLDVLQDEGIKVVRNKENKFWSTAANQGVAVADSNSKYLVFMHSDTVVLNQSWLDILSNISEGRHAGIVGTQFHSYYVQKQQIQFVQEWCMLMTKQCWNDIGPWPEELPLVGMSFIMTMRAQRKGHQPTISGNNIVHHYRAFNMDVSEYERMCEEAMGRVGRLMQAT